MITVEVVETIGCTRDEFLGFVMDIERYAEVDRKIDPVTWWRREGNLLEFECKPKLGGVPQPRTVQQVASFEASFECVDVDGGVQVTRALTFRFRPAVRWLLEPLLRRRLTAEVREEIQLAKKYLEKDRPTAVQEAQTS